MALDKSKLLVEIKGKMHTVVSKLKGYTIERINLHHIICKKTAYVYLNKYKRYKSKKFKNISAFNSTNIELKPNMKVVLGYLGKKITPLKSHTIIEVL